MRLYLMSYKALYKWSQFIYYFDPYPALGAPLDGLAQPVQAKPSHPEDKK